MTFPCVMKVMNTRIQNAQRTQHVLYFLKAGGSMISNMTFPCVMKVINVCISAFLYISLHFKTHCVQNNVQASLPEGMCDDDI